MYVKKWIPEPAPKKRKQMKATLAVSAVAGVAVMGSGIWYLKREKCL
jgi:hypothetical protein